MLLLSSQFSVCGPFVLRSFILASTDMKTHSCCECELVSVHLCVLSVVFACLSRASPGGDLVATVTAAGVGLSLTICLLLMIKTPSHNRGAARYQRKTWKITTGFRITKTLTNGGIICK